MTEPTPGTGYHACRHCDALAEKLHTWHQCPATGRMELCDSHRLLPVGLDVIDPYMPGEIELSDRLTAAAVDRPEPTEEDLKRERLLKAAAEHKARRGGGPGSLTQAGAQLLNQTNPNRKATR